MAAQMFNASLGKVHMCPSPFVSLGGHLYAVATVGGHMKDASGNPVGENQVQTVVASESGSGTISMLLQLCFKKIIGCHADVTCV